MSKHTTTKHSMHFFPYQRHRRHWIIGLAASVLIIIGVSVVYFQSHQPTSHAKASIGGGVAHFSTPLVYANAQSLYVAKSAYNAKAAPATNLVANLLNRADRMLTQPIQTVTDKSQTPPSGDKHDYYSLADYWWPNPHTSNGLPYVRRDGHTNPETTTVSDKQNFNTMLSVTRNLALAYYYSGQDTYAQKAAAEIRAWFVSPATSMNPNLNYAQLIKGVNNDGTGLIDLRYLPQVLDDATLIAGSPALSSSDRATVQTWMTQYLNWLQTSAPGVKQATEPNNHGSWYDAQIIAISLYLNQLDISNQYATRVTKLIDSQINADGSQPLELARSRSWDYSALNLEALLTAATAAQYTSVKVLDFTAGDGASLPRALTYLTPYISGKKWTGQQVTDFTGGRIATPLTMAQALYSKDFGVSSQTLAGLNPDTTISLEFYPTM